MKNILFGLALLLVISVKAQDKPLPPENTIVDTLKVSRLDQFNKINKKMEELFKILPFPMVSYSTETGTVFGLAKYNLATLDKKDTISSASSFSELISISTEGQFKVVLRSSIYLFSNKWILKGGIQYIEYPEWILGVGNTVHRENLEKIKTKRLAFDNEILYGINKKNTLYSGIIQEYKNYLTVETSDSSHFRKTQYPGYEGGTNSGFGLVVSYDTRDIKHNAYKGIYAHSYFMVNDPTFGSEFNYNTFEFEVRKYFNPWHKHVIAMQIYTEGNWGALPFFTLSQMGGTDRMRAYYLGAIRDKVIADAQIEYRMPIWNIFGLVGFASAGRVAPDYTQMDMNDLWYAGGFGFRIMVDSKNRANLRIDFGFGQKNSQSVVIGFTEAF